MTAFDPEGHAMWQVQVKAPLEFTCGVAVDPSGALWVAVRENGIYRFNPGTGAQEGGHVAASQPCSVAFDGAGNLYEASTNGAAGGTFKYEPPIETSTPTEIDPNGTAAVATNVSTGDVFINKGSEIFSYNSAGAALYPAFFPHVAGEFNGVAVDALRELLYLTDSNNKVEVWSTSANPPRPFALNVNGQGTVECELEGAGSFGPCASAYGEGKALTIRVAKAAAGYAFAGWIGCKQTGTETCTLTVGADSEVTVIFVKEGVQGPQGGKGEPGQNGSNGSNGATGAQGPAGQNGAKGDTGAAGPEGKQGPAGKVTCQVKQKGKKVKVTCTVKAGASAASVHWRLTHGGRTVRHGTGNGGLRLELSHLRPGHYRLNVQGLLGFTSIVIA